MTTSKAVKSRGQAGQRGFLDSPDQGADGLCQGKGYPEDARVIYSTGREGQSGCAV